MIEFNIKLAEIPLRVCAFYEGTREFCREYLTSEPAGTELRMTRAEIEQTRRDSRACDIREGRSPVEHTDEYLETVALLRLAAAALLPKGVLLFHGVAVALNGRAYLFTAKSGTGKTTHARLWLKTISGAYILNGDKPLLRFGDNEVCVCGTPWQGKEDYGRNETLPLAGICLLERAARNRIEPIPYKTAFEALAFQSHRPAQNSDMVAYLKLLGRLAAVPIYRLGCNMEDEAAQMACRELVRP